jgi:hypothetical protein
MEGVVSFLSTYQRFARRHNKEVLNIAERRNTDVCTVMEIQEDTWAMQEAMEQELLTARTAVLEQRNTAAEQLPEVLNIFRARGGWPRAGELAQKLGLPPTRGNVMWASHKLRQLAYQPQHDMAPAE